MPGRAVRRFGSVTDSQTRFRVIVVQGEDRKPVEECLTVAEQECQFQPRSHAQASLEVEVSYDRSSMVHVVVRDLVSGAKQDITTQFFSN